MRIEDLGSNQPYTPIWQSMLKTIQEADLNSWQNQIWLLEHSPVFTQGDGTQQMPKLNPAHIPVVNTDRGGDLTYHGPGQLIIYCLLDLRSLQISLRELIEFMEQWVIDYLSTLGIKGHRHDGQPGVFIDNHKVCSLGLRVKRGISYHGLALNIDMDLQPFEWINPCGYANLSMTQLYHHNPQSNLQAAKNYFTKNLPNRIQSIKN